MGCPVWHTGMGWWWYCYLAFYEGLPGFNRSFSGCDAAAPQMATVLVNKPTHPLYFCSVAFLQRMRWFLWLLCISI